MNTLNAREQLFVALGAAIGSNCVPCVEKIIPKAKAAGINDWELRLAINSADNVRQRPSVKVLSTAKSLVDGAEEVEEENPPCPLDQMESSANIMGSKKSGNKMGCCG